VARQRHAQPPGRRLHAVLLERMRQAHPARLNSKLPHHTQQIRRRGE
jgi:hypothetical protein